MKKNVQYLWALILLVFYACNDTPVPKPDGYFRIELPQQKYQRFNHTDCNFSFDYAQSAVIEKQKNNTKRLLLILNALFKNYFFNPFNLLFISIV